VGLILLAEVKNIWWAAAFVATLGPGYGGAITLRLTVQAEYFGRRAFGAIQGSFMAIMMTGTIASPLLTGVCFDQLGSYRPAWLIMAALHAAAIPVILRIRPPDRP
jgi:MFS family permease